MNKTITIRIDKETEKNLKKLKVSEKKNLSDIVRESLDTYIKIKNFRELRKTAVSYAEKAGYLTDEDIFEIKA